MFVPLLSKPPMNGATGGRLANAEITDNWNPLPRSTIADAFRLCRGESGPYVAK